MYTNNQQQSAQSGNTMSGFSDLNDNNRINEQDGQYIVTLYHTNGVQPVAKTIQTPNDTIYNLNYNDEPDEMLRIYKATPQLTQGANTVNSSSGDVNTPVNIPQNHQSLFNKAGTMFNKELRKFTQLFESKTYNDDDIQFVKVNATDENKKKIRNLEAIINKFNNELTHITKTDPTHQSDDYNDVETELIKHKKQYNELITNVNKSNVIKLSGSGGAKQTIPQAQTSGDDTNIQAKKWGSSGVSPLVDNSQKTLNIGSSAQAPDNQVTPLVGGGGGNDATSVLNNTPTSTQGGTLKRKRNKSSNKSSNKSKRNKSSNKSINKSKRNKSKRKFRRTR